MVRRWQIVMVFAALALAFFAFRATSLNAQTSPVYVASGKAAKSSDESAELGRRIFEAGLGRDDRTIIARVASGVVPIQGAAVACASCHRSDGTGGGEAWLQAPDVRWFALSKPYGARRVGEQARPPYDRASFSAALRRGVGSDGVELDPAMPRFDLADDEIDALISHLKRLSGEVRGRMDRPALVLLVPKTGSPTADAVLQGVQRCPSVTAGHPSVATLPALRVLRYDTLSTGLPELRTMASDGRAAALFAPFLVGNENAFAQTNVIESLPVILPLMMRDYGVNAPNDRRRLFALPDLHAQARALLGPAPAGARLDILQDATTSQGRALAASAEHVARRHGWRTRLIDDIDTPSKETAADTLLVLRDMGRPPADFIGSMQVRAPATFVTNDTMAAWVAKGVTFRLALPYAPQVEGQSRWIPPTDAWVAMACELMMHLPRLPERTADVGAWRASLHELPELRLGSWIHLPPVSNHEEASHRVFVLEWPARPQP